MGAFQTLSLFPPCLVPHILMKAPEPWETWLHVDSSVWTEQSREGWTTRLFRKVNLMEKLNRSPLGFCPGPQTWIEDLAAFRSTGAPHLVLNWHALIEAEVTQVMVLECPHPSTLTFTLPLLRPPHSRTQVPLGQNWVCCARWQFCTDSGAGPTLDKPTGVLRGPLDVPALSGWPTASQKERELQLAAPS